MRVLFVNHTGQISGAERCLLTLLEELPADVPHAVACPEGELFDAVRDQGVAAWPIRGTDVSLRLHPLRTPQGGVALIHSGWQVRRLARRFEADLVHCASIRAGVIAAIARRMGGPPAVVYVQDRLPSGGVSRLAMRTIARNADAILACSQYAARPVASLRRRPPITVVYNPVNVERFDPAKVDRDELRAGLGLEPSHVALAVIAQITPWKGQDDAIRALAMVRETHPEVKLLLVGSPKFVSKATRYDNQAFARSLERLIVSLGVEDSVAWLGERGDVEKILGAVDIVLVPSWGEPFGIAMIEAMAMARPVIGTSVGGTAEIIDGCNSSLAPPRRPDVWATEIRRLVENPQLRMEMGARAREQVVRTLSAPIHTRRVLSVYDGVLGAD